MAVKQQQLDALLSAEIAGLGFEYVGGVFSPQGRGTLLRIYIDGPNGVNIDDCAVVARHVGRILDVEDIIKTAYQLEISSPGLDRPLFKAEHYQRFVGKKIHVRLHSLHEGRRHFTGILQSADDQGIALLFNEQLIRVNYSEIERGNLEPEF